MEKSVTIKKNGGGGITINHQGKKINLCTPKGDGEIFEELIDFLKTGEEVKISFEVPEPSLPTYEVGDLITSTGGRTPFRITEICDDAGTESQKVCLIDTEDWFSWDEPIEVEDRDNIAIKEITLMGLDSWEDEKGNVIRNGTLIK